jgi:hypothetical protein
MEGWVGSHYWSRHGGKLKILPNGNWLADLPCIFIFGVNMKFYFCSMAFYLSGHFESRTDTYKTDSVTPDDRLMYPFISAVVFNVSDPQTGKISVDFLRTGLLFVSNTLQTTINKYNYHRHI